MSDLIPSPRRRPLWPVFVAPALVVLAAVAWSAFWFYAASQVDQTVDNWRAREAKAGRIYDCAKRHVAGFPFRLEVTCEGASVTLVAQTAQGAAAAPVTAQLGKILVVAQIYTPKLLIAEFAAPATLAERGQPPSLQVNWRTARSSIYGLPATPERGALVFDDLAVDRIGGATPVPLGRATHLELHGRLAEETVPDRPVIEAVLQVNAGSMLEVHPLLAQPFDADIRAKIHGLRDFNPKPWPDRFREMQAAGGRIEIVQSRIQQGDLISVAAGSLGLTADGHLDGELQMTVAGIEKAISALGIEKMLEEGVPQATLDRVAPGVKSRDVDNLLGSLDRMIPGLGKVVRQNASAGIAAGINALGTASELEGRKARSFPLRFVDGEVLLGPIKVGQVPPLF
ncbi:MAG: hypothetical protein BGP05_13765 [Rhizobiales bacterium 62-47]|nr:DUF2125 domain-containing protein [Hyphomicrobiales bacterium]OJY14431.1 MAG: hypothetical protein BGP05_13765 [Rhizobiales bacterium 62-47]